MSCKLKNRMAVVSPFTTQAYQNESIRIAIQTF